MLANGGVHFRLQIAEVLGKGHGKSPVLATQNGALM